MRAAALLSLLLFGCSFPGSSPSDSNQADSGPELDSATTDADMCRSDWFDCNYRARREITVENVGREALDGFPVAIRFDGTDPRFGNFGDQLRFRNDTDDSDLPFEVEDMGTDALVWVRVDLPNDGMASLSMYYDNPANAIESSGPMTFGGFAGVYHFSDTFGAADPVNSSTEQNNLDATSLSVGDQVATPGSCTAHIGADVDEYLETSVATADFILGDNEALSYEAWFRTASDTATRVVIDNLNNLCQGMALFITNGDTGIDGALTGRFSSGTNCQGGSENTFLRGTAMVDDNNWHYGVLLVDRAAETVELLVDGASNDTATGIRQTGRSSDRATRFGNSVVGGASFAGVLDEIRIGPVRNADWYAATYANNVAGSTMVTLMPEELIDIE